MIGVPDPVTALAEVDLPVELPVVDVEIVVPVYNEQDDLGPSVRRLHAFLDQTFPFSSTITIADNASTDGTWTCALELAAELPRVRAVHLDAKGRGRALHQVWAASPARVVAYMDVDLSTDLSALLPLVAPLISGHSDVAIGSRLARTSRVVRDPSARSSRAATTCYCARPCRPVSPMRSAASRRCGRNVRGPCCPTSRTPPGSSTPNCSSSPNAAACGSPRYRSTGSTTRTVASTSSRRRWPICGGVARVGRALARGDLPLRELREQLGRQRIEVAGVSPSLAVQAVRFGAIGVLSTAAYLCCSF